MQPKPVKTVHQKSNLLATFINTYQKCLLLNTFRSINFEEIHKTVFLHVKTTIFYYFKYNYEHCTSINASPRIRVNPNKENTWRLNVNDVIITDEQTIANTFNEFFIDKILYLIILSQKGNQMLH